MGDGGLKFGETLYARYTGKASYLVSAERVARYRAKVQELLRKGYRGEELAELSGRVDMMEQGFLKLGHGKYDGIRGIDSVYQRFGNNPEIAILESKWRVRWSAGRNPETALGRGYGFRQMSPGWIRR